jgi:hypothetical protein
VTALFFFRKAAMSHLSNAITLRMRLTIPITSSRLMLNSNLPLITANPLAPISILIRQSKSDSKLSKT